MADADSESRGGISEVTMEEVGVKHLREWWLYHAAVFLFQLLEEVGVVPVPVRVSCGWPSHGGMGQGKHVIGQCFAQEVCADGVSQIFISPRIAESIQVLGTLLHELIHAAVGCEYGHGKQFSQVARRVGLSGPPTATIVDAGSPLYTVLQQFVTEQGAYPHAPIRAIQKQKAGSRLRLFECECDPPIKLRVARDELRVVCLECEQEFALVESE